MLMVAAFIAAITAMAFGNEPLSIVLFVAGLAAGAIGDQRDQRRRRTRAADRRLVDEVRRHR
jgi:hypothetical protein